MSDARPAAGDEGRDPLGVEFWIGLLAFAGAAAFEDREGRLHPARTTTWRVGPVDDGWGFRAVAGPDPLVLPRMAR